MFYSLGYEDAIYKYYESNMILYLKRATFNKCSILVGDKETICIGSSQNY